MTLRPAAHHALPISTRARPGATTSLFALALALAACGPPTPGNPDGGNGDGGDAATRVDAPPSVQGLPVRDCTTRFSYPLGRQAGIVAVAGQWNGFSTTADRMTDGIFSNVYRTSLRLPPGSYGYKFVADGNWSLDPTNGRSFYVDGIENSRVDVPDCDTPLLRVTRYNVTSDRTIELDLQYIDGAMRAGLDPASLTVTMNRMPLAAEMVSIDRATARVAIRARVSENNKYTFRIAARDTGGRQARELIVPMWVEDQPFEWGDGPLYFAFTDRFRNGNPANDAPVAGVEMRANYQGGDLAGVLQALREGYFDALGVRSIWLSPVNANTNSPGRGADGRQYSAYHGYWVSEPRTVEEHFGTLEDLRAVTAEAHRRGIRVLIDIANNQLHRDHPYYAMYREGFNGDGSCVCGGPGCDWDSHALDCWFTNYLPDVNWTNMPMVDRMIDDALWWLVEADVDGFRVDAVKHMQHIASTELRHRIRDTLETGNARYYLVGETFTGAEGRGLIQSYISDHELWGQFDFPLFWAIRGIFAQNGGTMADLDNAVRAGESTYQNATMSPFLGNHDVERFLSQAAGDLMGNTMDQAWNNPPPSPDRDEPYERLFLAFTFLLGQPGVPLIYYGDEIGMPGAADPDNRRMMKWGSELSAREQRLLDRVRIVARARGTQPGLRRGARRTLHTDGDGYVFARGAERNLAIIALNRGTTARRVRVNVPAELGAEGQTFRDLLGGPSITVSGGGFDMPFTPRNAALYVRQ
jgi:glycosidase